MDTSQDYVRFCQDQAEELESKKTGPSTSRQASVPSTPSPIESCLITAINCLSPKALDQTELRAIIKASVGPFAAKLNLDWQPHYTLSTFSLSPIFGRNPAELATLLAKELAGNSVISRIEAVGPYMNFSIAQQLIISELDSLISAGRSRGRTSEHHGQFLILDYVSPALGKRLSRQDINALCLGESMARLWESTGYHVIRDLHPRDWGFEAARSLVADSEGSPKPAVPRPIIRKVMRQAVQDLEHGNPDTISKWRSKRDTWASDLRQSLHTLGLEPDISVGDAFYAQKARALVKDISAKNKDIIKGDADSEAIFIEGETPHILVTHEGHIDDFAFTLLSVMQRSETLAPELICFIRPPHVNPSATQLQEATTLLKSMSLSRVPLLVYRQVPSGDTDEPTFSLETLSTSDRLKIINEVLNPHSSSPIADKTPAAISTAQRIAREILDQDDQGVLGSTEEALAIELLDFPRVLASAVHEMRPELILRYLQDITASFERALENGIGSITASAYSSTASCCLFYLAAA